jgi:hypothetical protein
MKDVLLLHYNVWRHTSLRTRETFTKIGWTVLPHPAHIPDLSPSDNHQFGPVKEELRRRHFAHDDKLKQSFRVVFRSRGRKFYNTGRQRLTQHWQKCVKNCADWKNSLKIAKDVWIFRVNFVTKIIFSEKKIVLLSYRSWYQHTSVYLVLINLIFSASFRVLLKLICV